MIDPLDDELVPLVEVARSLPRLRNGRPVHVATVWRWAKRGLGGVKLETIKIGGTTCTSKAALRRFFSQRSRGEVDLSSPTTEGRPAEQSPDAKSQTQLEAELARRFRI